MIVDDTIVAIATPPGRGGIGVVRVSGPEAPRIAGALMARQQPLAPRRATFARIDVDEVVATLFPAPHSYTGQHVVEISAHGSPVVLAALVRRAMNAGARLARPGEFTLRAFLNGKRDLVQAEAIGDLIASATPLQARVAFDQLDGTLTRRIAEIDRVLFDLIARLEASLDFPDEGYHFIQPPEIAHQIDGVIASIDCLLTDGNRGRMIREGATVVIAGRPNVGKSSMFNKLAGADRAIVTEIPGTTRDLVTERIDIGGLAVTLVDTAGSRDTLDVVEREGVARGTKAADVADLVLLVMDGSEPLTADDERLLERTAESRRIVVVNKCDRRVRLKPDGPSDGVPLHSDTARIDVVSGSSRSIDGVRQSETNSDVVSGFSPTIDRLRQSTTNGDVASGFSRTIDAGGQSHANSDVVSGFSRTISASALTGEGIPELRDGIVAALTGEERLRDTVAISNTRHIALLESAREDLSRARDAASQATPEEFLLTDLQSARTRFDEIVGTRTTDDVLAHIFDKFCIGK
jgi:tRNA modification GTPase